MLTKSEIIAAGIVQQDHPDGWRESTYDATVGKIVSEGKEVTTSSFTLKSRGVVWVISKEQLKMPKDITAVATLKTSWAHLGVVALNVGVVDPGWDGPISTAIVNFSRDDFVLTKDSQFLRLMFFKHSMTNAAPNIQDPKNYFAAVKGKSRAFSKSFLSMSSLVHEVSEEVFKLSKWAFYGLFLAIGISILATSVPVAWSIYSDVYKDRAAIISLEHKLNDLEQEFQKKLKAEEQSKPDNEKKYETGKNEKELRLKNQ